MEEAPPDESLMLAFRQGDSGAFETLYRRHKGGVFRYLQRQCGNPALADELAQDVWLRVVNARGRYEPTARFTTWIYTIAHNRLMDHFRARGVTASVFAEIDDADPDPPADPREEPDALVDRSRLAARLMDAIQSLPPAQREAFLLQQEAGLSVEEIAETTGVPRETAKSRLRYALAKLRAALESEA